MGRAWKKKITYPRLGYAEIIAKKRTTRKRRMLLIVLTALLVLALMYRAFLPSTHGAPIPHEKLALGACVAAIIAGGGHRPAVEIRLGGGRPHAGLFCRRGLSGNSAPAGPSARPA